VSELCYCNAPLTVHSRVARMQVYRANLVVGHGSNGTFAPGVHRFQFSMLLPDTLPFSTDLHRYAQVCASATYTQSVLPCTAVPFFLSVNGAGTVPGSQPSPGSIVIAYEAFAFIRETPSEMSTFDVTPATKRTLSSPFQG
jgi:hypothetical protein